jgi:hypothetical protein
VTMESYIFPKQKKQEEPTTHPRVWLACLLAVFFTLFVPLVPLAPIPPFSSTRLAAFPSLI